MSLRVDARSALLALLACACGTVDPGQDFQFAQISYDSGFFYCKVEPMLFADSCGPGDPRHDGTGGCHYNVTTFRLTAHAPVTCTGIVPKNLGIPAEAQSNYEAAEREMTADPDRAPLLDRPTQQAAHPRKIFDIDSPEADLIRQWATDYTSQ